RTIASESDFHRILEDLRPQLVILDILDTEESYVQAIKDQGPLVVALEDLGPGARCADLVINDLYTDFYPQENHWYGVRHAILAPQFDRVAQRRPVQPTVERIVVTFGGTDQRDLTRKSLAALQQIGFGGEVCVACGPGYDHPPVDLEDYELNG